jgi:hypothetical protein
MRRLCLVLLAVAATFLGACGGDDEPRTSAAPGTPENPLVAQPTGDARGSETPSYESLLDSQTQKPRSSFTPCNLVPRAKAGAIMGADLKEPLEAPQGPTCIYQTRSGSEMVTVSVQALDFEGVRSQLRRAQPVSVDGQTAWCGQHGQPMLYMPLAQGEVLAVAGQCAIAKRFAASALPRLSA